jgi:Domain of unknown function (DUF4340)
VKFGGLLTALVILAALVGGVYWSNKAKEAADKAPPKDAAPKVLTIADADFKTISLKKTGGDTTVVQKSDAGKWQITGPKPLPADQDSVSSLVSTLASVTSDRLIEDKASDLAPYGLASPPLEVIVTKKDGKTEDLLVGDDTPTGGGSFVKLRNDPRVFSVASNVKSSLDKTSKDLRDKRLLTFDSDKLTRVDLQAKGQPVEFGKNNQNEWQILKPKPLRADGSQVEELIRKLKDAKMDTTVSDEDAKKAVSAFASGTKVAVANVSDSAGTQTLEVRKDKDKNYYAKSSAVEGIFKVTADLGDGLDKDLDSFRTKKLFDFGFSDPTKVTINQTAYQKTGEKWMNGAKQMDSGSVQAVVDKLRDLVSTKFLDSGSGPVVLEIGVTSNDGKRNEKVTIMKQGAGYIAKRENEPSVYELDSKAVDELQKTAAEVKEFQPPKPEPKKK